MRFVPLKTKEQLELQAIHRIRQRFITERTATINQMRALLLEQGIVVPVGRKIFEKKIPLILEDAENELTFSMRALIHQLRERWRHLDKEIDAIITMLQFHGKYLAFKHKSANFHCTLLHNQVSKAIILQYVLFNRCSHPVSSRLF